MSGGLAPRRETGLPSRASASPGSGARREGPGSGAGDPPRHRLGYQPALDGIRAISILAVIAFHLGYRYVGRGYYGVDVFFVLSGFLITTILLREREQTGRVSLRLFWARRAARLLPALFAVCAAVLAIVAATRLAPAGLVHDPPNGRTALIGVAAALGYVSSWIKALSNVELGTLTPTWSLSVEEWFYALWPLLLILFLRRPRRATRLVVASAAAAIAYRVASELFLPRRYLYFAPDQRACQLLVGCALGAVVVAYGSRVARFRRSVAWLGLAGSALTLAFLARPIAPHMDVTGSTAYEPGALPLIALATAAVIACVVLLPAGGLARALSLRPLVWVGRRSYGLYLYHAVVIQGLTSTAATEAVPLRTAAVSLALVFLAAAASYRWIEQPVIRWMRERETRVRSDRPARPATRRGLAAAAAES